MLTVDGVPLILVLALGQFHDLAETTSAQGRLCILSQLVARRSLLATGSRPELVAPIVAALEECQLKVSSPTFPLPKKPAMVYGDIDIYPGDATEHLETGRVGKEDSGLTYTVVMKEVIVTPENELDLGTCTMQGQWGQFKWIFGRALCGLV